MKDIIKKYIRIPLNFLKSLWLQIKKDNILIFAQALSFTTLLTLIPILGLVFSILKIWIPQKKIDEQIILFFAQYLTPEATSKITNIILELSKKLENFPLGKFSIIAYFLIGSELFSQIEEFLNHIFKTIKRRTIIQRFSFYWLCITLAPILFLPPVLFHTYLQKYLTIVLFFSISFFFFLLYIYFPARKIPKKEALIGALFSTLLWFISSYGYGFYVKYAVSYSKIYGSLSAIPLFLIWIFINWVVFLLGAELTVFLENRYWRTKYQKIPHSWLKLWIIYFIGKNFLNGKTLSLEELTLKTSLPPETIQPILEELEKQNILSLVEGKIFLIRPPEKIYLKDLFSFTSFSLIENPEFKELYKKMQNFMENFSRFTLKDLF